MGYGGIPIAKLWMDFRARRIPSSREGPPSRSAAEAVAHERQRKTMRVTDHGEVAVMTGASPYSLPDRAV